MHPSLGTLEPEGRGLWFSLAFLRTSHLGGRRDAMLRIAADEHELQLESCQSRNAAPTATSWA